MSLPKSNFHAVLIGFNSSEDERLHKLRFAEKDAKDFQDVLVDPKFGGIPEQNITLLTGYVNEKKIEEVLFSRIVKDRNKDDTVLVYYSGHSFIAGNKGDVYLATPDVSVTQVLNNPREGLSIEWLHNDIFLECPAKYVVFILDCCYSGAFCPQIIDDDRLSANKLVDEKFYKSCEGRVAFVSSPTTVISRESNEFQNGVFTFHVLNALKGGARELPSGEVTVASLINYVQENSPPSQPSVFYGQSTRIVLAAPSIKQGSPSITTILLNRFLENQSPEKSELKPLPNPIDKQLALIDTILINLKKQPETVLAGKRILDALSDSFESDFILVARVYPDAKSQITLLSTKRKQDVDRIRDNNILSDLSHFFFADEDKLEEARFGYYRPVRRRGKNLIVIPLRKEFPREFLIIHGVDIDTVGDVLGDIILSLYESSQEFSNYSQEQVENSLFDGLKSNFGYVPKTIYDRKFESFSGQLNKIQFAFEPIINLGKMNPQIDSWEALARDPAVGEAPKKLFATAELWGEKFLRKLDLYCLENSVKRYVELWNASRGGSKKDVLSVNLYPVTLFRPEYRELLRTLIVEQDLIKPQELVLEISERRPPGPKKLNVGLNPLDSLEKKIHEYTDEFGIAFAIDDFGVGNSSVERLIRLELDHVKVDREVLVQRNPEITIEYVLRMVKGIHSHHTNIVIEGFDGKTRISLSKLFELGIRYVQGHLLRRASPDINDLTPDEKRFILDNLNGKNQSTRN